MLRGRVCNVILSNIKLMISVDKVVIEVSGLLKFLLYLRLIV